MELLTLVLAVFAITHIVVMTDGPFGVFYKLREKKHIKVMNCFTCFAFWVSLLLGAIASADYYNFFLLTFALTGGATFLHFVAENY